MWSKYFDKILEVDYEIWYAINIASRNSFFDAVMPFLRNQYFWAPVYVFLLVFMLLNYKRIGFLWCLAYLACFGLADYTSASIIKPWVQRPRPCNDPILNEVVNLLVNCGSGYSFPSAHAANHFAMSLFIAITIGQNFKWVTPIVLFWAFSVSIAQVYVGVHYPLDIFCGAIIGTTYGGGIGWAFHKRWPMKQKTLNIQL